MLTCSPESCMLSSTATMLLRGGYVAIPILEAGTAATLSESATLRADNCSAQAQASSCRQAAAGTSRQVQTPTQALSYM